MSRLTDNLLQDYIKYTNKLQPFSKEISYDTFPEQEDDVGSTITLKFRDRKLPEYVDYEPVVHRPEDDVDIYTPKQYKEDEEDNFITKECTILRHDKVTAFEPKMIVVTKDRAQMLCIKLDQDRSDVYIYPHQITYLIGVPVQPQYVTDKHGPREAYIVAATVAEPLYCIIIEYVKNGYRIFTSDEVQCKINLDLIDDSLVRDIVDIAYIRESVLNRDWHIDIDPEYTAKVNFAAVSLALYKYLEDADDKFIKDFAAISLALDKFKKDHDKPVITDEDFAAISLALDIHNREN